MGQTVVNVEIRQPSGSVEGRNKWTWGSNLPSISGRSEFLGFISLYNIVVLESRSAFLSCILRDACCSLLDIERIGSMPFDDRFGVYWVGWVLGVGEKPGPILGLVESVGRLDDLSIQTKSFADFCWDFEGGALENSIRG